MLKQVYEIDELNILKEVQIKDFDEQGNCLEELADNIVLTDIPQGLYRAKWTGTEWVEDMSQTEIDELNNQPKEPTEVEKLQSQIDTMQGALDFIILNY